MPDGRGRKSKLKYGTNKVPTSAYAAYQSELRRRKLKTDPEYRERYNAYHRRYRAQLKKKIISAYGGKCACCGETEPLFLSVDHVKGNGNKHRRLIGGSSHLYPHLQKMGFPKAGYQLLCFNCNMGRALAPDHVCPHKRAKERQSKA